MNSSNHRLPCSEWRKWDQVIYRFQLPPNKPYYALPRELSSTIIRDGVDRVWFIDNAENCVRMRLWREKDIMFISAKDVKKLVRFCTQRADVGIEIQHLNQKAFSAQILTHEFVPLQPFPNAEFFAGRVLPRHVQNQLT
ncbi:hypothetical protein PIB30_045888 [Stylosanthes scabra]|uniref:Uncharacterized protein n=1 Tax=Stylosanthes scabra TaxID=79078 RepID=A0ABU6TH45_9FABA|nr:hypothetical protein [Stylosanthes scabra]